MKFGLFYELSVPRPWTRESERTVYYNALAQVKLADELGFDYVWAVEHHFLEEYSHCSAPEVFLAAASQRTKNIRLGFGVMMILPPFNHPIRCAERAGLEAKLFIPGHAPPRLAVEIPFLPGQDGLERMVDDGERGLD
jgi:hypothetical protein